MASTLEFLIMAKDQASDAFDKVGTAVEKNASKIDKMQATAGVALTAITAGAVIFGKQSIDAYADAAAAQSKLEFAYEKFPAMADTNIEALRGLNAELQKKTGIDGDETAAAQASLAAYGLTGSQIAQLTPLIQDYAAKTGKDMATAADDMGKAMLGSGKALKSVGVDFTDAGSVAGNFDQVMGGLKDKVGGTAEMMGETATGKSQKLKVQWEDLQEMAGEKLLPMLTSLTEKGIALTGWMTDNPSAATGMAVGIGAVTAALMVAANWTTITTIATGVQKAAQLAGAAATGVVTAAQWAWNAALTANPIGLVIVGIAALAAGLIYAYNHSETFRKIVDGAFKAIGEAATWLWNNALQPVIVFMIKGFADVGRWIGNMLEWLGKIPGFEWAADAAKKIKDTADKVEDLTDKIKKIPPKTEAAINVTANYSSATAQALAQGRATLKLERFALGGRPPMGQPSIVGEEGPELFIPDSAGTILSASRTAAMYGAGRGVNAGGGGNVYLAVTVQGDTDPQGAARRIEELLTDLKVFRGGTLAFQDR